LPTAVPADPPVPAAPLLPAIGASGARAPASAVPCDPVPPSLHAAHAHSAVSQTSDRLLRAMLVDAYHAGASNAREGSMKKAAIVTAVAVVVLVGGALAAQAYLGMTVAKRLDGYSDELVQVLPSAKVTERNVHHGLLHTTREVTVQLGCLPDFAGLPGAGAGATGAVTGPQPIRVTIADDIRHGPFLGSAGFGAAAIDSKLVLPEAWKPLAKRLFGDQPPLVVHTIARFDGRIESTVQVAGIHVSEPGLGGLDLVPIAMTVRTQPAPGGGTRVTADAGDMELRAGPPGEAVTLKAIGLKSETTMAAATGTTATPIWLRPGSNKTQLSSLTIRGLAPSSDGSPPKAFELGLDDVTAGSQTKVENGLMSSEMQVAMKGRFNEVKLDKLEAKVAMRRIHVATYQKLMTGQLGTILSCDPNVQQQAMAGLEDQQKELFAELLVHDPEYALDQLAIELAGQRASLSYSVGTKGMTKADFANPLPALLTKIVAKVAAEIQLGLIERMVKAASEAVAAAGGPGGPSGALPPGMLPPGGAGLPDLDLPPGLANGDPAMAMALVNAMIGHAVEEGYVVKEGDKVRFSAELAGGKATLNGKPFELPDLGAMAMPGALPIGGP
jgi:hypothetical protein